MNIDSDNVLGHSSGQFSIAGLGMRTREDAIADGKYCIEESKPKQKYSLFEKFVNYFKR